MSEEELLKLFNKNWYERSIFKKHKDSLNLKQENQETIKNHHLIERAMSDEMIITKSSKTSLFSSSSSSEEEDLFLSPKSVLTIKPSLQTILSGKEVRDFTEKQEQRIKNKNVITRTRRGKSMSDLEYEELKGFKDLGFVFSEEDHKDSELVSILPGLQRLLFKKQEEQEQEEDKNRENRGERPYLSEAWEHCGGGRRKGKKIITPEIKWRIPATATAAAMNEVDLKDNLKLWAHAVASTIR
ncbi:unnamed protein product [Cochlearia groenlandica]